jgi:hypothetical protein
MGMAVKFRSLFLTTETLRAPREYSSSLSGDTDKLENLALWVMAEGLNVY